MSWRTRSVEVEYQTLLEDESEWTAPENIDQFLQYTYDYFVGKGFATIAIGKSLEIVEMLFVAVMLTFLVCFIDYSQLSLVQHLSQAIAYQGTPFLVGVALLFFSSYFSWHVMLTVRDLYKFWAVADFYKRILKVDENRLPTMKWAADTTDRIDGVVDRLIKVPRLVRTRQQVTVLDIANRIMRRDNYLIALANSATPANQNLLRLPRWCWNVLGGKQLLATQVLERAVQIVIMPPLLAYAEAAERRLNSPPSPLPFGSMNDPSLQPQRRVTAMQRAAASIRTRARVLAVVGVVLAPVAALYMTLHSALEYAAALRSRPTALAARTWTPLTRWQCREYNELPHVFERRMNKAHQPAQKYLDAFPRTYLVVPARFGSFIVSALIACLLLLSLAEDDVLVKVEIAYGRAGVWWLGVLGSLLAVFRSVMPDVHVAHEPQKHLNEVTAHTHDAPLAWKGRAHDVAVRDEFSQRYQLRLLLALRELLSLLLAPVLLAWHVPYLADDLVTFVDRHTANVEGVGTVCQLALFNTKGVGDGGKLAKSMISFQAHHPKWCPPPASKATLAGVAAFARATPRKSRAQEQRGDVRRPRRRSPSPDTAPPSSRTNDNDDNVVVVGAQDDAGRTSRTVSAIESSFAQLRASLEHSDDFRAGPAVLRGSSRGFARGGRGGGGDDDDDDDNDAAVSALDSVVDQMVAARIADAITAGTAQDINQLLQESDDFMAGPASSQSFVKLDNNNDHDDFDYHRAQ